MEREEFDANKAMRRRDFIKSTSVGLLGTMLALDSPFVRVVQARGISSAGALSHVTPTTKAAKVSLVKGGNRYDNIYKSLKMIEEDIKIGIGNKQVVIKPNNVVVDKQLAATHVDCIAAILDVLKPICQKPVIIAESPSDKPAEVGFENYGYKKLLKGYNVQFFDLDKDPHELHDLASEKSHAALLASWRRKLTDHLAERGDQWVKSGRLVLRKKPMLYGPNYPRGKG